MKTTIIKTLAVGRLAILTMAAFLLLTMPGHAEDEAAKNSIREVQQALNGCGFNAGAIDGDYGKRTTQAAAAFVRAHGGNPNTGDKTLLLAQVDFYRAGDAGPCPPEGTEAEATASNESEPAGEAGSVTAEAGSVEADQGEEVEVNRESELIAEVRRTTERSTSTSWFSTEAEDESLHGNVNTKSEIEISDDEIIYYRYRGHPAAGSEDYVIRMKLSDIGEVQSTDYLYLYLICRNDTKCSNYKRVNIAGAWGEDGIFEDASYRITLSRSIWEEGEEKSAVNALENLISYYDGGTGTTTGQPVKCYNWVNLGTFNLGKWRNGNGRETSGLPAGSGIKIWDDEELLKDYKAARQQCVSSANGAMDSAVSAMVLIGRQASDVDNEKKRIRSFYKASLDKCQSEFDRRHKKYQNKFCE